jgi:hypothetical protein
MTAIIPDTLQGALILSLIDFIASFVIISGIGMVLALFPLLNRIGSAGREAPPAAVAYNEAVDLEADDHVAAIAAAVYATLTSAHRIVRIEPTHSGDGWAAGGRLAHHGSHIRYGTRPPPGPGSR